MGAFSASASPYGTYDQGGNVWEWIDTADTNSRSASRTAGSMGGSWSSQDRAELSGEAVSYGSPTAELADLGFRLVQAVDSGNGSTSAKDRTKPKAKITSAKTVRGGTYTLRVSITDNLRPKRMEYRFKSPDGRFTRWFSAELKPDGKRATWSKKLSFKKRGSWQVEVRAYDAAKNRSATVQLTVRRTK